VVELSPSEAKQAVWDGRITDAKTITSLFWLDKP
jgi:ADP-ribose pyrophosphatase